MSKILVVDDESALRLVVRTLLETEGYEVSEAADGEEALALIEEAIPDVILLDLMMPNMDGWKFLEQLRVRDLRHRTRVVIVSALTDEETVSRGRAEGASHLSKPFDMSGLLDAVRNALCERPEELLSRKERLGELAAVLQTLEAMQQTPDDPEGRDAPADRPTAHA